MIPYAKAICYSGYREDQSPHANVYPSYEEVLEDLNILSKHFDYIRMYDVSEHPRTVLKVISENNIPLKVMLGVEPKGEISNPNCSWGGLHSDEEIEVNKVKNYEQLDELANLCNRYKDVVLAASVGNENTSDWHGNLMPASTIAMHAKYLKTKTEVPVTFCEGAHNWVDKGHEIAREVDFISIHSYPVWLKTSLKDAYELTINDYYKNKSLYPDKQIIFTEYGWTTKANDKMNTEETNEINQKIYLEQMDLWSEENKVTMFVFEAFDEPWKGSKDPDEPEKHWGIMDVKRKPKLYATKYFK
jgi:exo-beta-1,3-glucanase (GH17 family)